MLRQFVVSLFVGAVFGQQQCYYAAGGQYRGPDNLVPCNSTGASSCCLLGDTCLSGNTCYNPNTGNLYQYGCTDITYNDETCPYKCGFDPDKSPWTALEYCADVQDLTNTWICHGPESCGCDWPPSKDMLILQPRGCRDMGSLALVALYAPQKLAPYVSLPSKVGGSTGYYSPTLSEGSSTWIETAVPGYTPEVFTQLTTYRRGPTSSVWVDREAMPGSGTYAAAMTWTGSAPTISAEGTSSATSDAASGTGSGGPSLQSETDTADAGLSTGAKAGIGVGVAGGVLFLAGLGICLYCFGRKRRHKSQAARPDQQHGPEYPPSPPQPQMPPYTSPPQQQQMHWAPIQSGPPLMDPGYGYGTASPQQSEMSRSASQQGKVSYSQVSSSLSSRPVPVLPMELAGEELRRSVHEMEGVGVSGGDEEERKGLGVGMGMAKRARQGMGDAF